MVQLNVLLFDHVEINIESMEVEEVVDNDSFDYMEDTTEEESSYEDDQISIASDSSSIAHPDDLEYELEQEILLNETEESSGSGESFRIRVRVRVRD